MKERQNVVLVEDYEKNRLKGYRTSLAKRAMMWYKIIRKVAAESFFNL